MNPVKNDADTKVINKQLKEHYGISTESAQAMWRIVWSDDEMEMQKCEFSQEGLVLLYPEVRLVPKYRQWIQQRYILEHLVGVPDVSLSEIPSTKMSYEPIWTFENAHDGSFLPPIWRAVKLIVDTVHAAMGGTGLKKYVEINGETGTNESHRAATEKRLEGIENELFGEMSSLEGATKTGEAVGYTVPSFVKDN